MLAKLILVLYFINGTPDKEIHMEMTRSQCTMVREQLKDVYPMFKADGAMAVCLFTTDPSEKEA